LVATNYRLIYFDVTLEHFESVGLSHQRTDLHPHPMGAFVSDTQRALQFLAAHAVARRNEQVDRIEPNSQRGAAVLKDRLRAGVHVIATRCAGERAAIYQLVKRAVGAALPALMPQAETNLHNVRQAGVIIGEAVEEFPN